MNRKKIILYLFLVFIPLAVAVAAGISGNPFTGSYRVSSEFGPRTPPNTGGGRQGSSCHKGIDFATPVGTPMLATISGQVVTAGSVGGYGNTVVVQSANYSVLYGHLDTISVSEGQTISQNMTIGTSGNTGNSSGPHLHYEIRVADPATGEMMPVNPALVQPGMNLDDPAVRAALIAQSTTAMETDSGCNLTAAGDLGAGGEILPPGTQTTEDGTIIGCDEDIRDKATDRVDALMQQQFEAANAVITQPTPVEQLTCFDQTTQLFSGIGGIFSDPESGNIDDTIVPNVQQPLMASMEQFLNGNIMGGVNDVINQAFSSLTGGLMGGGPGGGGDAGNCDMMEQSWLISQCIEMPQIPSLGDILGGQIGELTGALDGLGNIADLANPERLLEQVCSAGNDMLQGYFGDLNASFTSAAEGVLDPITDRVE